MWQNSWITRQYCGATCRHVYKIVKPKELRDLFLPYHTMDPTQAIDRILEAKGLANTDDYEEKRQFEIFKRIRKTDE